MCTVAIMQPTYLPWLGYFDMLDQVDAFVLLDNVQFAKRSWQQRNRLRTEKGLEWLTVPATVSGRVDQLINEVQVHDPDFASAHLARIHRHYARAAFYETYADAFGRCLAEAARTGSLCRINTEMIAHLCGAFGCTTPLINASSLTAGGQKAERLANICAELNASAYLSAPGSAGYLLDALDEFSKRGIAVSFHQYASPVYRQQYAPFLPGASVVDVLFNEGPAAADIIRSGRKPAIDPGQMAALMAVGRADADEHGEQT